MIRIQVFSIYIGVFLLSIVNSLAITFKPSSVLSSGIWYKLAVLPSDNDLNVSGSVYKIDYSSLEEMGIDPSSINPRNIKIYGGGLGSVLPQSFSDQTIDDLEELTIHIEGESDNSFDASDYILFYASYASKWVLGTDTSYEYNFNPYGDSSVYYLTVDNSSQHIDLVNATNESGSSQTLTVYDEHYHYEKETNFTISDGMSTGRNLLDFQVKSGNTGNVTIPSIANISTALNATLKYSVAQAFKNYTSNCDILVNNNNIGTLSVPPANNPYFNIYTYVAGTFTFSPSLLLSSSVNTIGLKSNTSNDRIYLDWYQLFLERSLVVSNSYLPFRSIESLGNTSTYSLSGLASNYLIWDVTDPALVKNQLYDLSSQSFTTTSTSEVKEFIAFDKTQISKKPVFLAQIDNQNLHALSPTNLVIITHPLFENGANELANHRASEYEISTQVVDVSEIYNEFSAGRQDPTAIRNFIRMLYDKGPNTLKYVLLFGDGSYDYRHAVKSYQYSSYIPSYQSRTWNNNVYTYQSDDYYSLLEDGEGEWLDTDVDYDLDISVGRIPLRNTIDMTTIVQKLKDYDNTSLSKSNWNTKSVVITDDGHNSLFVTGYGPSSIINGAEGAPSLVADTSSLNFRTEKIYLDAYSQQASASGSGVDVVGMNDDIVSTLNDGALLVSYIGHGSTTKLTSEGVTSPEKIKDEWLNKYKLPIVMIGSCSFGKFDQPQSTFTGADAVLFSEGGGIAMFSPTRFVFATANELMLDNLYRYLGELTDIDRYSSLGDIYKEAKNNTYQQQGYTYANRGFSFLGDPSMRLRVPKKVIQIDSINGNLFNSAINDTLESLQLLTIHGSIMDKGSLASSFSGVMDVTIYDRPSIDTTLGSELGGSEEYNVAVNYKVRDKTYFNGNYTVTNGKFAINILMPKYVYGLESGEFGKISFYAFNQDSTVTASAAYTNIQYEFAPPGLCTGDCDDEGPEIKIFIGDTLNFTSGDAVSRTAPVKINLIDSSGISTTLNSVGRNVTAEIRNMKDPTKVIAYYSLTGQKIFKSGQNSGGTSATVDGFNVDTNIVSFEEGTYSYTVTAWDFRDNVSSETVNFRIINENETALTGSPNPFSPSKDDFKFDFRHEFTAHSHEVTIEVVDQSGIIVSKIEESFSSLGSLGDEIIWEGKNNVGEELSSGIYTILATIRSLDTGETVKAVERLVIIN